MSSRARARAPRPFAIWLVVAVAVAASVASTGAPGDGISGASETFAVVLDESTPDFEQRVTALLDAQVQVAQDGQIGLTALFDDADVGQVNLSITSDTTGELGETQVLDPIAQPEVSVGIDAFVGCDGLSPCEEALIVRFERLEADVTNELEFEWELDGLVSVLDADADAALGTLTFTAE